MLKVRATVDGAADGLASGEMLQSLLKVGELRLTASTSPPSDGRQAMPPDIGDDWLQRFAHRLERVQGLCQMQGSVQSASGATISAGSRREISGNGGARTRTGWRAKIAAGPTSQVQLAPPALEASKISSWLVAPTQRKWQAGTAKSKAEVNAGLAIPFV